MSLEENKFDSNRGISFEKDVFHIFNSYIIKPCKNLLCTIVKRHTVLHTCILNMQFLKKNCYFTVLISPDILESKVVNLSQLNNILTIYLFNNMIRMLFDWHYNFAFSEIPGKISTVKEWIEKSQIVTLKMSQINDYILIIHVCLVECFVIPLLLLFLLEIAKISVYFLFVLEYSIWNCLNIISIDWHCD